MSEKTLCRSSLVIFLLSKLHRAAHRGVLVAVLSAFAAAVPAWAADFQLSGKVTDNAGNPIAGATVAVLNSGTTVASTLTDDSGNYFLLVASGTYDVRVTPAPGSAFQEATIANVSIAADTVLNVTLVPAGTVTFSGVLRDRDGTPVSSQLIRLLGSGPETNVLTAADGSFSLSAVPGDYTLGVRKSGSGAPGVIPDNFDLFGPQISLASDTTQDLTLSQVFLDVTVQDSAGNPLPGTVVNVPCTSTSFDLFPAGATSGGVCGSDTADANGRARITLFPAASANLTATPPASTGLPPSNVTGISVLADTALTVTIESAVTFSGVLTDRDGTPVPNQLIRLLSSNPETNTPTAADGSFSLNVAPGNYTLGVRKNGPGTPAVIPNNFDLFGPAITLNGDTTQNLNLANVLLDVTVQDSNANPVPGASVNVPCTSTRFDLFPGGPTSGGVCGSSTTDAAGVGRIVLFSAASVAVNVTPPSGSGLPSASVTGISVLSDAAITVTLELPVNFSGVLRDRDGVPVPNQLIRLRSSGPETNIATAGDGSFSLDVSPGTYSLGVRRSGDPGSAGVPNNFDLFGPSIDLSSDTVQDLTLQNVFLDITIQDPFGGPIPDATVTVPCVSTSFELFPGGTTSGGVCGSARSDAGGLARITLFPATSLTVNATPPPSTGFERFSVTGVNASQDTTLAIVLQLPTLPGGIAITDLGTLGIPGEDPRSLSKALNDLGQVGGESGFRGFRWTQAGGLSDLGGLIAPEEFPRLGRGTQVVDINNTGEIVGDTPLETAPNVITIQAFRWTESTGMTSLGDLGVGFASAADMNNAGQVVGTSQIASGEQRAFRWTQSDGMAALGTLGGRDSGATAINELGQVVGFSLTASNESRPFLWTEADGMMDLGAPPAAVSSCQAKSINDAGQVIGECATVTGTAVSFFWSATSGLIDIGSLGGGHTQVAALNRGGQVVGHSVNAQGEPHGFLWTLQGGMIDLGALGGLASFPRDINDAGQVVGSLRTASGENHAFLWTQSDGMVDLGTLGGDFSEAVDINEVGQIAGQSTTAQGDFHAVLWTVPTPPSDIDGDGLPDIVDPCPADPTDTCNPAGSTAEEVNASSGGTVETSDGALALDIDPGDLVENTTISVTQTIPTDPAVDLTVGPNPGLGQALAVYDLEPDGLQFDSPVTLTIVADVTGLNANQRSRVTLYLLTDTDGDGVEDTFVEIPSTVCSVVEDTPGTFTATCIAEVDHFSTFAMLVPLDTDNDGVPDRFAELTDVCPNDPNIVEGLLPPLAALVAQDGGDAPLPERAFKQGRTLPLKLRFLCGAQPLTAGSGMPPEIVSLVQLGEATALDVIDLGVGEANDSGTLFRLSEDDIWIFNLGTKSLAPGIYELTIRLPDGRLFIARFELR